MEKIKHSPLGASTCHRWWECPGSVALIKTLPEQEPSLAAATGTAAHQLAEYALKIIKTGGNPDLHKQIGFTFQIDDREIEITEAMYDAVTVYIDAIKAEVVRFGTSKAFLSIEEPFQLDVDKEAWGTNDCSLYKPFDWLKVWDYKNGAGIVVDVKHNKQLMYYALGALKGKNVERIDTYIVQPNANHPDGVVRKWEYTIEELKWFEQELGYAIERTRDPKAKLSAGTWCKFCPAIGDCSAVRAETQMVTKLDFATVNTLSVDQLVKLAEMTPRVNDFLKQVHIYLTAKAERGEIVEGFKLVKAKSNRVWKSETRVITDFKKMFGDSMLAPRKILSPAKFEKLAKDRLKKDQLLPYIDKPNNGLVLVPNSDPRTEVKKTAGEDFKGV